MRNISGLRAFYFVVTRGSIEAAAKTMHLSQPTVSKLVSGLEYELGINLFSRSRRNLVLTSEGAEFFERTERLISEFNNVPAIAQTIADKRAKHLSIICVTRTTGLVARIVKRLTDRYPDLQISLEVQRLRSLKRWIGDRRYDLGVAGLPTHHDAVFNVPILRAAAAAVLPLGSPLAENEVLTARDFKDVPLACPPVGMFVRTGIDEIFAEAGVRFRPALEVASSQMIVSLVSAGVCSSILDGVIAMGLEQTVEVRPLRPARWNSYGLVIPRGSERSSFVDMFKAEMNAFVEEVQKPDVIEKI